MRTWLVWDRAWGVTVGAHVVAWTKKGAIRKMRRSVGFLGSMQAEEVTRG